jgi:hypothetical protein
VGIAVDFGLADGYPEVTAGTFLAEGQGTQVPARGNLSQDLLPARKRWRRRDHLGGADVHQVNHGRGGAALGQVAGDSDKGHRAFACTAFCCRHCQPEQTGSGQGRDALGRPARLAVDIIRLWGKNFPGQIPGPTYPRVLWFVHDGASRVIR